MKKTAIALLLFFLFVGAKAADPAAYQVELTIEPLADSPVQLLPHQWRNGFRCEALIVDDATATGIGVIRAVVQPGKREITEKKIGDLTLRLGVQIGETATPR